METRKLKLGCALAMSVVLLGGCARDRLVIAEQSTVMSPQPPPLLATPAVYLLTNNNGFLADVQLEDHLGKSSGRLFANGAKLFYAPVEKKRPRKYGPSGGFSFLWDAAKGEGYVLSEALQGYAPISHSAGGATNLTLRTAGEAGRATAATLTAQMSNGKSVEYQASSGPGSDGVPSRIAGGQPPFSATLEKVRAEPPPAEVFQVPSGFTAYKSGEAMVDELAIRYRNLKRKIYN